MVESRILLIESNYELRAFIKMQLELEYELIQACSGAGGVDAATKEIPDLIIADVDLPSENGLNICRRLKNDSRTKHIPIIVISGQSTLTQQLMGLNSGADLYLTKPCNIRILRSYIHNLLQMKHTWSEHFKHKKHMNVPEGMICKEQGAFLGQLKEIVEANIGNSAFTTQKLAREIGISRSVLYKRLKETSSSSPAELIKLLRLQKAAIMLLCQDKKVVEVAWEVGFNEWKYFSKEFKKHFGQSPVKFTAELRASIQATNHGLNAVNAMSIS
ncbi:helix-turn-helix domain-containing protein [Chitinophaga eiseniae]|uniref:Helix-turn-helix domain-containing protein n=1 Tax=Chitinophaga eiseniae TaxID=634771 RepID=A0A847SQQ2_9BACT|nr:helix-turn-helix domain-containing protein [Chitinophaga eiseniae]NLR78402.1 helix-turn-helix domain-containing protein [Chitinophaga eiseniae]